MLGGSSSINGMVFVRGQAQDYDHWAQLGTRGWSYQEVLPIFKKIESYDGGSDEYRGRNGPSKVTDSKKITPLFDKIIAAAKTIGIKHNSDYNGQSQEGIAMPQASINSGRRQSPAYSYLAPASSRSNHQVQTGANCESLIINAKK